MKRLSILAVLSLVVSLVAMATESKEYAVKVTKAPVFAYEGDVTSPVLGYLDYGDMPLSELSENYEWLHVSGNGLEGWCHILSMRHVASEEEDIELANGAFAGFLKENNVDEDVIKASTGSMPLKRETPNGKSELADAEESEGAEESFSARGLEPKYIYIINEDVECQVNEAYAYHGTALRYEKVSEKFEGNTWFAEDSPISGTLVMMSQGKGYDLPSSACHLMTEDEYNKYVAGELKLHSNPELGSLKLYLESHDIAQAKDWNVDFAKNTRKTVWDFWPIVIPVLLMVVIMVLGKVIKINSTVFAYVAIADLLWLGYMGLGYITTPSAMFNDYGGLAWIIIGVVALVCMGVVLFTSWVIGETVLDHYDVKPKFMPLLKGFGIGVGASVIIDLILISVFGIAKDDMALAIVNMSFVTLIPLGMFAANIIKQNPKVSVGLPAVIVLWLLAIIIGIAFILIVLFGVFAFYVWQFMSGNYSGFKGIPGLVGSESATCGKCALYGSAHCAKSNVSASTSPCDKFTAR